MRSLATRDAGSEISQALPDVIAACKVAGFDLVIVETSGIGQGDAAIVPLVDVSLYVMTPEFGARASSRRSTCSTSPTSSRSTSSTARAPRTRCATCASSTSATARRSASARRDAGVRHHRRALQRRRRDRALPGAAPKLAARACARAGQAAGRDACAPRRGSTSIVPPARVRYLAEIADTVRGYHKRARAGALARERQQLREARAMLGAAGPPTSTTRPRCLHRRARRALDARARKLLACGRDMQPPTPATSTW
jgi:methylmalonyl-CoA mutase